MTILPKPIRLAAPRSARIGIGKLSCAPPKAARISYANPDDPVLRRCAIAAIEHLSGQTHLQRLYESHHLSKQREESFWDAAVRKLDLKITGNLGQLGAMPRQGPLLIIANHPFGVVDGMILSHLVGSVRADFKLIAHEAINRAPEVRDNLLPIAFDETERVRRNNFESCRRAIRHIRKGGALIIFPAGEVSTAHKLFGKAVDAPWKAFTTKLIHSSQATVLPVYFEGQNSWLFHACSKFSAVLREGLLMNEVTRQIGGTVSLHLGRPLPYQSLPFADKDDALLRYLRSVTYGLAQPVS